MRPSSLPLRVVLAAATTLLLPACAGDGPAAPQAAAPPRERPFDGGWRFARDVVGDPTDPHEGAQVPGYDDAAWREVDLPHDFGIEDLASDEPGTVGPFTRALGRPAQAYTYGGTGWYRRHFTLDPADAGKRVAVLFDGVLVESDVWLNGHHLGHQPYGYTAFAYDLTPHLLAPGQDNVLAVRARNRGLNSRWYTGSGLYREVRLVVTDPVHVDLWGVHVTTPEVSAERARVRLTVTVVNDAAVPREVEVRARLVAPDGTLAASATASAGTVAAGSTVNVEQLLEVAAPLRWSPATPHLHELVVELHAGGARVDSYPLKVGLRSLAWDAVQGLRVNGVPTELRGAAIHHDNGLLGGAAFARAEERKVELLKASGFNAIRTAHNPPSRRLLEACDRLGVLVVDEFTDVWNTAKSPDDYAQHFAASWTTDLASMLRRDRNHPRVVWSIGNEIPERFTEAGLATATALVAAVRDLDLERPITEAFQGATRTGTGSTPTVVAAYGLLDLAAYNYNQSGWEPDHAAYPAAVMLGGESVPLDAYDIWSRVDEYPWVVGDFVWSAMDYLGEPAVGYAGPSSAPFNRLDPWPWVNAWCGDLDLTGEKKPQSAYRDVVWGERPLEVLVHAPLPAGDTEVMFPWAWPDERPSWTWPGAEGTPLTVTVYTRADAVRLELDGVSLGEKPVSFERGPAGISAAKPAAALAARFEVPYAAGTIRAVALAGGVPVATRSLSTSGPAVGLVLRPDRPRLGAARDDLAFVRVEAVDAAGNLDPNAATTVDLAVSGPGELVAAGSAMPNRVASFQAPRLVTFRGKALAVVRPTGAAGTITLTATGVGLLPASLSIAVE
ncbi:MAG: glycoside hydrolase family 2 TIM barrel-domain containing protein [Anaeromyxobacteraceae bacterium]